MFLSSPFIHSVSFILPVPQNALIRNFVWLQSCHGLMGKMLIKELQTQGLFKCLDWNARLFMFHKEWWWSACYSIKYRNTGELRDWQIWKQKSKAIWRFVLCAPWKLWEFRAVCFALINLSKFLFHVASWIKVLFPSKVLDENCSYLWVIKKGLLCVCCMYKESCIL